MAIPRLPPADALHQAAVALIGAAHPATMALAWASRHKHPMIAARIARVELASLDPATRTEITKRGWSIQKG